MSNSTPYKQCPHCGQAAVLDMVACRRCGYVYPNAPFQPATFGFQPTNPTTRFAIENCSQEYRSLTHLCSCLTIFFLPAGGLGIIIGLILWMRYADIRNRVALLGVNVDIWEAPLKDWARGVMAGYLGLAVVLYGFIFHAMSQR